jgi:hypothetical protein
MQDKKIKQNNVIPRNNKGEYHGHWISYTKDGRLQSIRNYINGRVRAHIKETFQDGTHEEGYIAR